MEWFPWLIVTRLNEKASYLKKEPINKWRNEFAGREEGETKEGSENPDI